MYKYKIHEFMENLTVRQYKFLNKLIPKVIDKSINTFNNYRNLQLEDEGDIPYETVRKLEILFGIEAGSLANDRIEGKNFKELMEEQVVSLQMN